MVGPGTVLGSPSEPPLCVACLRFPSFHALIPILLVCDKPASHNYSRTEERIVTRYNAWVCELVCGCMPLRLVSATLPVRDRHFLILLIPN